VNHCASSLMTSCAALCFWMGSLRVFPRRIEQIDNDGDHGTCAGSGDQAKARIGLAVIREATIDHVEKRPHGAGAEHPRVSATGDDDPYVWALCIPVEASMSHVLGDDVEAVSCPCFKAPLVDQTFLVPFDRHLCPLFPLLMNISDFNGIGRGPTAAPVLSPLPLPPPSSRNTPNDSYAPPEPKTDASTHHGVGKPPEDAELQYERFSVPPQASMVVWIRSLVGFDMPGHRNSGPTFAIGGRRPGTIVVLAWMRREVVGPKLQLAPQPSPTLLPLVSGVHVAAMACADGKAKVRAELRIRVRNVFIACSSAQGPHYVGWDPSGDEAVRARLKIVDPGGDFVEPNTPAPALSSAQAPSAPSPPESVPVPESIVLPESLFVPPSLPDGVPRRWIQHCKWMPHA
jgi:hypothetical protein